MTWRGSTTVPDRIFASLPYLLPLIHGLVFGIFLFNQFSFLRWLQILLNPIISIYDAIPLASLVIFFALFLLVVRNERINHFIRFNAMQAILLDIVLFICDLLTDYILLPIFRSGLIIETIFNTIFLGLLVAVGYGVIQSLLGRYAEIPTISEAAYMQVR